MYDTIIANQKSQTHEEVLSFAGVIRYMHFCLLPKYLHSIRLKMHGQIGIQIRPI